MTKLIFNIFGNKTACLTSDAILEVLDTEKILKVPEILMKNLGKNVDYERNYKKQFV